jgi:hypothetical protein
LSFKVEFRGAQALQQQCQDELRSEIKLLATEVFSVVTRQAKPGQGGTPVKTGQALAGWKKSVQPDNFTIENAVPYIEVLDKGRHMTNRGMRGSKQAPKGIIGPSLNQIKGKN